MSLVNINNLLSPFRKKFQLVGLLVAAFLVFVVRWVGSSDTSAMDSSSGSLSRDSMDSPASIKDLESETEALINSQLNNPRFGGKKPAALAGDQSVDDLLAGLPSTANQRSAATDGTPGRRSPLADVQRELENR
jgi:hypothetical protein